MVSIFRFPPPSFSNVVMYLNCVTYIFFFFEIVNIELGEGGLLDISLTPHMQI